MTLRQLRRILEITDYCHIWILGYGEIAQPLYKLIAETQQAQTDKLVWSPETQKAFKVLQTALLQAPALSLPTGSKFNLFVTKKKGMALRVLTQPRGPHQQCITYLNRKLGVISHGWSHCPRVIGTVALLTLVAAKLLQSCPTLCDPIDGSPPGFPVPGILQARTLEWVAISFSNA